MSCPSVLLGAGAGSLAPVPASSSVPLFLNLSAADFNRDGVLDLGFATDAVLGAGVQLGDGGARFGKPARLTTGSVPGQALPVDLEGDGRLDLLVSDFDQDVVRVYSGTGDGTFKAAASWPVGGANFATVFAADMNEDGVLDGRQDVAFTTGDTDVGVLLNRSE